MAKSIKVPTLQEMLDYQKLFSADPIHNCIKDTEHSVMLKPMTQRIFSENTTDELKTTAWKFCKTLANFSHAPVAAADYKRMEKWLSELGLIDVLLKACDGYFPDPKFKYSFDTIGFSYSIALISQSQYKRSECLALLDRITQYYVNTKDDWYTVLLRNMKVLMKFYPDLAQFKADLETI